MGPVHFQVLATTLLLVAPHVERDGEHECNQLKTKLGFELRRLATQIYANYPVFVDFSDAHYAHKRAAELATAAKKLFGNMMAIAEMGKKTTNVVAIDDYCIDDEQVRELGANWRVGKDGQPEEKLFDYSPPEYRTVYEDDDSTSPPPHQQSPRSPSPQPADVDLSSSAATWGGPLFASTSK